MGESCEFPSHDERTTGKTWRESLEDEKSSPGWFPCNDYPEFVTMLRDVIHHTKTDARIIFWTYNWGYVDTDLRVKLIDAMPAEGITMMATYEMFEPRPGVHECCTDYTLFFAGPGKYFSTEAETAGKRGIDFMTMCNTYGFWPSFLPELAKAAYTEPRQELDYACSEEQILWKIARLETTLKEEVLQLQVTK